MRLVRSHLTNIVLAALCCAEVPGCRRPATSTLGTLTTRPATSTTTTQPAMVTFGGDKFGITLDYPADWSMRKSDDFDLLIIPPGAEGGSSISLDVPDIPFHIPGMIPLSRVQSGYVDDVRKQLSDVAVEQLAPPSMPGSTVRLVRCTGHLKGRPAVDFALLVIHADRVFILRASADTEAEPQIRAIFDGMIRSIRWVKP